MNSMINFTHLHTHSEYSFRDGMSRVPALVDKALEMNMPAIALTDHGGMHGIMTLFDYCKYENRRRQEQGKSTILPIAGCEVFVSDKKYHLVLLAKNLQGYRNLCKISSSGYLRDDYKPNGKPIVEWSTIERYHEGLICLSGCLGGELAQMILKAQQHNPQSGIGKLAQSAYKQAEDIVLRHQSLFGEDYYIEIQRHETHKENACTQTYESQKKVEPILLELARKYGIKVVATNDSHFLNEEDAEAHDVLLQINYGRPGKPAFHFSKQEWFKSQDEMAAVFADMPEVLSNTQEIVDKVEPYDIQMAPVCPKGTWQDSDTALMLKATLGMTNRFGVPSEEVEERLRYELNVFRQKHCADYILFWWDILRACREELNVSYGPGRGSVTGSLVLYCLEITDVNPLEHDLLFERFYNVNVVGFPDIDIDFSASGRDKVVEYIRQKYGNDCVMNIITHRKYTAKSALIDTGNAMGLDIGFVLGLILHVPYRFTEEQMSQIGFRPIVSLDNCYRYIPEFVSLLDGKDERVKQFLEVARRLENHIFRSGSHICSLAVAPSPVTDYVPVCKVIDEFTDRCVVVTQYDVYELEKSGLIKFDLLGFPVFDMQHEILQTIQTKHGITIDWAGIPLDDEDTLTLFQHGNTTDVFQFESADLRGYLSQLKHLSFDNLVALHALYRPGSDEHIPTYIARCNGEDAIACDIPVMERCLHKTCGMMIYQEQLMVLAGQIGNLSQFDSNKLRKAVMKLQYGIINELLPKFLTGGLENGYSETVLCKIWNDWKESGRYLFMKSHAVAYTLLAYRMAYLKAHYPDEFTSVAEQYRNQ